MKLTPVGGSKSLLTSESLRLNRIMLLRDAKECCSCLELFFVGEMQQRQAIWCIKSKSLDINLIFIERL